MDKSSLGSLSHEKSGMSPLIATILLIAFAVALGTMIITWLPNLDKGTGPDCSGVTMFISPYLCYAENMIKMSIRNSGDPVAAITVKVIGSDAENIILLRESAVEAGSIFMKDVSYTKTGKTAVELYPSIKVNEEVVLCDDPAIVVEDLPDCQ